MIDCSLSYWFPFRIPFEKGRELAERYQVEPFLKAILEYDPHAQSKPGTVSIDRTPTKEQAMAAQRKSHLATSLGQQSGFPPGAGLLQRSNSPTRRMTTPTPSYPSNQASSGAQPSTPTGGMQALAAAAAVSPMAPSPMRSGYSEPPRKKIRANASPFSSPALGPSNGLGYGNPDDEAATTLGDNIDAATAERHRAVLMAIFLNDDPNHIPELLSSSDTPSDLDVEMIIDDQGHTALHWAAALARITVLRLLVERGANVRRINFGGETALMRAVLVTNNYDLQTFASLVDVLGESIPMVDRRGRTVFHHIALTSGIKIRQPACRYYMETLLEWVARNKGGDAFAEMVNLQDEYSDTAINLAARMGCRSIVDCLADIGARWDFKNRSGLSADDYGIGTEADVNNTENQSLPDGIMSATASLPPPQPIFSMPASIVPSKRGREIVTAVQQIVDDLETEFTSEISVKTQEVQDTQAQLRQATKELAEARRHITVLRQQALAIVEAQQRVRNLENGLLEYTSDDDADFNRNTVVVSPENVEDVDVDAFFSVPDSGFAGSEDEDLDELDASRAEIDADKENQGNGYRHESPTPMRAAPSGPLVNPAGMPLSRRAQPPNGGPVDQQKKEQDLHQEIRLLRARLNAYVRNDALLRDEINVLRSQSTERELNCKRLIATCCNVPLDQVDDLLGPLTQAVESDGKEIDLGRVAGFMNRVRVQSGR